MTKTILYSVFALALLTTTVGCPPPAPPADVNVDTDAPVIIDDNMTGTSETPSDNMTAVTETPSDNMTTGSETP